MQVRLRNVTRLCKTKALITVNGRCPGPTIVAREGDRVIVKVTNHVKDNITIHWYNISIFLKMLFISRIISN